MGAVASLYIAYRLNEAKTVMLKILPISTNLSTALNVYEELIY